MTCESFLAQFAQGCNSLFVSTNPWAFVYLSVVLAPLAAVVGAERGARRLARLVRNGLRWERLERACDTPASALTLVEELEMRKDRAVDEHIGRGMRAAHDLGLLEDEA